MHKLLNRQLKRRLEKDFDLESLDPKFLKLFNDISDIYHHNETTA